MRYLVQVLYPMLEPTDVERIINGNMKPKPKPRRNMVQLFQTRRKGRISRGNRR
jgi:hypothetical protein